MSAARGLSARPLLAMFVALWVGYTVAGIWTTARINATGDEPFYLMAADAFAHGEGFDLSNRFEVLSTASYAPIPPLSRESYLAQTSPSLRGDGRFPLHDLGLSLLLAAPLAIGGRALVIVVLGGAMAAAVVLGMRAARRLGAPWGAVIAGGSLSGLAAPALTYSGQVFPDTLAALPVAVALCALVGSLPRVWLGAAVAVLPLLHVRFWPLAVGLLLTALVLGRVRRGELAMQLVPLGAAVAAMAVIDGLVYGLPVPHAGFLLFFREGAAGSVAAYTAHDAAGLLGLFFDRSRGLIPAAPIALLAFVGAGALATRRLGRALLLGIVPYLLAVSYLDWTGGYSPHARYLTPLVAMLVVVISGGVARVPAAAAVLGVWTVFQSGIYVVAAELRYDRLGQVPLADQAWTGLFGFAPTALFPSFGRDAAPMIGAALLAAVLILLGAWRYRSSPALLFRRGVA